MASMGQPGGAARAAVGVGAAVAVAAAGALAWWFSRGEPAEEQAQPASALTAPVAEPQAAATPQTGTAPEVAPLSLPPPPVPPTFDLVRVEADGAAQVAGRGAPDARILLQVDGAQVAEAPVAPDGAFVALFTLAPNPLPSLLSLVMVMPDGQQVPGSETVALAPIAGPVVVAEPAPALPDAPANPPATELAEVSPAAPAALLLTEQGVQVLQAPAAAAEVGAVSIDTISYAADGSVQFGGRGAAAQVVRLYLDNAELAEATVAAGGQWGVAKAGIAPGLYTLRADQLDASGKVTSRFETPFQRETLAALAEVAAPQAPALTPAAPQAPEAAASGAAPDVVAAAAPESLTPPDPLATPAQPAGLPVISSPAKAPIVDPVAPASPDAPTSPTASADPVTAATDPAPASVAAGTAVPAATPADPAPAQPASPVSITVQPGLTLWAIAEANFGDGVRYVQVYEANKDQIRDPDLIYPGQVFTVPAEP